jgi:hypothetical protein
MRELIVATFAVLAAIAAVLFATLPMPRALCVRTGGLPALDGRCVARSVADLSSLAAARSSAPPSNRVAELGKPAPAVLTRSGGETFLLQPLLQILRDDLPAGGRGEEVERGALVGGDVDRLRFHDHDWSTL